MSSWDIGNGDSKKITLTKDGEVYTIEFPASKTLGEAVKQIAKDHGLTAIQVLHDGADIPQSQSSSELSSFDGKLEVMPKAQGM